MKKFSKILSVALLVALVLSLGVANAFAETVDSGKGGAATITISNATKDVVYSVVKLFDATVGANGAIAYTGDIPSTMTNFFEKDTAGNISLKRIANNGIEPGQEGYVDKFYEMKADDFAVLKAWASEHEATASTTSTDGSPITFTNLPYGYYVILSSLGSGIVTVDSTNPSAEVIDKNQTTTYDKQESVDVDTNQAPVWLYVGAGVEEDPVPSANVGDKVDYKVTGNISHYAGEEKVVSMKFFDTMTDGLTLNKNVVITVGGETITSTADIVYDDTANTTTITFPTVNTSGEFLYANNAVYVITYSATVNENAIIDTDPEDNTVEIYFNENNKIGQDTTKVTEYQITLTKQDGSTQAKLAGAEFDLYDAATEGNQIPVVLVPQVVAEGQTKDSNYGTAASEVNNVYRHAKAGETGVKMVVGKTGIIEVKGLKNGSYYFEETKAPDGYNKLTTRTPVTTINNGNATITVDNNKGTQLPSTGGIGTTIFYVVGGVLVLAAIILLVTKKRMSE